MVMLKTVDLLEKTYLRRGTCSVGAFVRHTARHLHLGGYNKCYILVNINELC